MLLGGKGEGFVVREEGAKPSKHCWLKRDLFLHIALLAFEDSFPAGWSKLQNSLTVGKIVIMINALNSDESS